MGERLLCKQEVIGSIPFTSTTSQRLVVPDSGNAVTARGDGGIRDGLLKRSWKIQFACNAPALPVRSLTG